MQMDFGFGRGFIGGENALGYVDAHCVGEALFIGEARLAIAANARIKRLSIVHIKPAKQQRACVCQSGINRVLVRAQKCAQVSVTRNDRGEVLLGWISHRWGGTFQRQLRQRRPGH